MSNLEKCDQNKQSKFDVRTNLPLFVKSLRIKPNHVLQVHYKLISSST